MTWRSPLTTTELIVLHVYRRVPPPPSASHRIQWESRWARICREVGDHIARVGYGDQEEGIPRAIEETFATIDRLVEAGYLDGAMPSWSLYRLTEQGVTLLDRWKRAGFPR